MITRVHVLRGVLDVEGTAGQVLRGLGVDVDLLRASLATADGERSAEPSLERATDAERSPRCPSCNGALEEQLVYRIVTATSEWGAPRDVALFSCGACGFALCVEPA